MFLKGFYFAPDETSGGTSGAIPATDPAPAGETQTDGQPQAIDWSNVKIPDDVLANHPLVVALEKRVKERDEKLKKLREAASDEPAKKPEPQPQQPATPAIPETVAAELAALRQMVENIVKSSRETLANDTREAVMRQYNLPAEYSEFLVGTPDEIRAKAAKLAAGRQGSTSPAAGAMGDTVESKTSRLIEQIKGEQNPFSNLSIFDPVVQKQHRSSRLS